MKNPFEGYENLAKFNLGVYHYWERMVTLNLVYLKDLWNIHAPKESK